MTTDFTFEEVPIERHEGGIDWRRVIVEFDRAGCVPKHGLKFRRGDQSVEIIDPAIGVICTIPLYKVLSFAPDALIPMTTSAVNNPNNFTALEAKYIAAEINAERADVFDEPDSEYVFVEAAGYKVCAIHRRCLVPSWPLPDEAD